MKNKAGETASDPIADARFNTKIIIGFVAGAIVLIAIFAYLAHLFTGEVDNRNAPPATRSTP